MSQPPADTNGRILLVEDRDDLARSYRHFLEQAGFQVDHFPEAKRALRAVRLSPRSYVTVVSDYQLPDLDGLSMLRILQEEFPRLPVVFVTGHGNVQTAIEATKLGAYDYVEKPIAEEALVSIVREAAQRHREAGQTRTLATAAPTENLLVGRSRAMMEIYKSVGRVAAMDAPVLILGETGTGKELVARAIHENSVRSSNSFNAVNCAAIPENLLESELFGYEKGAFTGATSAHKGLLAAAHGGTVLLDEIGDMPLSLQSKLLRVLQEKSVVPLGSVKAVPTNIRIIAATHQNLLHLIAEGRFRQDLYHRLAVWEIRLPALRERQDDIPLLADYFLQKFASEFGLRYSSIDPEALDTLLRQPWPGNVRQLQNVIRTALLKSRNLGINKQVLDPILAHTGPAPHAMTEPSEPAGSPDPLTFWLEKRLGSLDLSTTNNLRQELLDQLDTRVIELLWNRLEGNRSRIATVLGMSRLTLRKRIEALQLKTGE